MPGSYGTRVYVQSPSTASVGGGAVTRTWATTATVHADIDERGGVQYVQGVPVVTVGYRIRIRKPVYTLTGTEVIPTTDTRIVTVDEASNRTFHVSEVSGFSPRDRWYTLIANQVSS